MSINLVALIKKAEESGIPVDSLKPTQINALATLLGAKGGDKDEKPLFTPAEAEKLVQERWGKLPYFDVITGMTNMDVDTPGGLNDVLNHLCFDVQGEVAGNRGREQCRAALDIIAIRNVRNKWLEAIPPWDQKDRMVELQKALNINDTEMACMVNWVRALIGMQLYRKELETNLTQWRPPMLILYSGTQAKGKNWLLKQFCLGVHGAYNEKVSWAKICENSRDEVRRLKRCIIASFDENPTGIGREMYDVKSWITTGHVPTRGIFAKFDDPDNAILSAYAGTSNFKNMLTDASGNRRYQILNLEEKQHIDSFNFAQFLAQVRQSLPAKLGREDVPWSVPLETEADKSFIAARNVFDGAVLRAFEACEGLTTLENIADNLSDVEARNYYMKTPHTLTRRLGELFDYDGEFYHLKD